MSNKLLRTSKKAKSLIHMNLHFELLHDVGLKSKWKGREKVECYDITEIESDREESPTKSVTILRKTTKKKEFKEFRRTPPYIEKLDALKNKWVRRKTIE